jgi:hypothetical protein
MIRKISRTLAMLAGTLFFAAFSSAETYPTISYKEAADHLGEIVWIEGTVLRTENAAEGIYLLFNANEKYLRLLIPKANVVSFDGSVQHKYTGKKIKAVGKVSKYGYKLILGVNESKRIRLVEDDPT